MKRFHYFAAGFTLIELLIAIMVLSILIALAAPSMSSFFDSKRLIAAAEQIYSHVQQARTESLSRSTTMSLNFSADGSATWQYGLSHRTGCDLTQTAPGGANACVIVIDDGDGSLSSVNDETDADDLVLMRFTSADHTDVSMSIVNFGSGTTEIGFDPNRATTTRGDIRLVSGEGKKLTVRVGLLGQVRICSPDGSVPGYSDASCT